MNSTLLLLWKAFKPTAIVFAVCNAIIYNFNLDIGKVGDKEFLFNFFGLLLGFALTIFAFIMSMVDKIRERIQADRALTQAKADRFKNKTTALFTEIKENIFFTFISLIIIGLFLIFQKIAVPKFHLFGEYCFDRVIFSKSLKLSLFLLNIYAIYDLIIISFKISDGTAIVDLPPPPNTP